MKRAAILVLLAGASSCAVFGPSKEDHPKDVEASDTPRVVSGACDGDQAPTLEPASFFAGPYEASTTRPEAGALVAFEGVPRANMLCTQKGCASECCDNSCGAVGECAYALRVDTYNEVCLDHPSFSCGGTDCSGFCTPFSMAPQRSYRFVGRIEYEEKSLGKPPVLRVERFCVTP